MSITINFYFNLDNMELRLSDGTQNNEGRLEVQFAGRWGTVCQESFDNNIARVFCHMLGYSR